MFYTTNIITSLYIIYSPLEDPGGKEALPIVKLLVAGDAADSKAAHLIAVVLRADEVALEVQAPRVGLVRRVRSR